MVVVVVAVAVWLIRLLFDGVSILPGHLHKDNGTSVCLHPGDRTVRKVTDFSPSPKNGRSGTRKFACFGGGFKYFFGIFTRKIGEDDDEYFSNGLVQPPT